MAGYYAVPAFAMPLPFLFSFSAKLLCLFLVLYFLRMALYKTEWEIVITSTVTTTSNRANMQTPYSAFLWTKSRTKYFGAVFGLPPSLPGGLGQFQANGWEHLRWREMISTLISTEIPLLRMDTTPQMKERTHLHLDCFPPKQF